MFNDIPIGYINNRKRKTSNSRTVDIMKTIQELKSAVMFYCSKHGHMPRYIKCFPDELIVNVLAMDYTEIEAKIIQCKNGKTKLVFKVDGKVVSIKK